MAKPPSQVVKKEKVMAQTAIAIDIASLLSIDISSLFIITQRILTIHHFAS
jgi:DNA-binding XRE family transcriptional regulator